MNENFDLKGSNRTLYLEILKQAVTLSLDDPNTKALFGQPVDASSLPDYLDIIESPKDLGTILSDIDASIEGDGPYDAIDDILGDVNLVWQNCLEYNNRPEDAQIISICRNSKRLFGRMLQKACKEAGVEPDVFSVGKKSALYNFAGPEGQEISFLPLKSIDNFEITSAASPEEPIDLITLGYMRCLDEGALLSGELQGAQLDIVSCEPIIDWAVDRYEGAVFLWAITGKAWYKLESPSPRYSSLYSNLLQGIDIVERGFEALDVDGNGDLKATVENIAANMKSLDGSKRRTTVPFPVKKFAIAQLEAYCGKRKPPVSAKKRKHGMTGGKSMNDGEAWADMMSDDDMPDDFEVQEEDFSEDLDDDELFHARKKAWRRVKYQRKKAEENKKLERIEKELLMKEIEENERRGCPPKMRSDFRIPGEHLHKVLFAWSFLQEFGDVLNLPPFSLSSFEAALYPGPSIDMLPDEPEAREKPAKSPSVENTVDEEMDDENIGGNQVDENNVDDKTIEKPEEENAPGDAELGTSEKEDPVSEPDDVLQESKSFENGLIKKNVEEEEENADAKSTKINEVPFTETEPKVEPNNSPRVESVVPEVPELEANVQENIAQVPVKRGRGRPRKDGSNPRPSGGIKKAPQNIIYEPTIKTRRQKGINVPIKNLKEEYSDEMEAEDDRLKDADFSVESEMRGKVSKAKINRLAPNKDIHFDIPHPTATNSITEALKATQKLQEEYEARLRETYAVSFSKIQNCSPLDKSYSASGILLRDIVTCLTGAIGDDIQEASSDTKQPSTATVTASKGLISPWPEIAANTVWSCTMSSEEAKHAALHLAYGDFIDLSGPERIEIISSLVYEALESKVIGNEINKRMEKQLGMKFPFNDLCMDPGQLVTDLRDQIQQVVESDAKGQYSGTLREWMAWVDILRVGMKRYVGEDFNGRRYWALGNESGAFRIFCQDLSAFSMESSDLSVTDSWGYYEGESLEDLISWLGKAKIRKETILLASLSSAPVPTSLPTPSAPARKLSGKELLSQQADGYRSINYPLLRGEWNLTSGSSSYDLPIEQRASLAMESILGSIPFWFKDNSVSKAMYGISDIILSGQVRDSARALIEADNLLALENKVTQEWVDVWSPKWRANVAGSFDQRETALQIAALQSHVIMEADVIPRGTFLKILDDLNCTLLIPEHHQEVAVMRSGILFHIEKAMTLLGLTDDQKMSQKTITTPAPLHLDRNGAAGFSAQEPAENIDAAKERTSDQSSILPLKPEFSDEMRMKWLGVREKVFTLNPVERYIVRGIVYRRHLADSVAVNLEGYTNEEAALMRRPVAWIYLKPTSKGPPQQLPIECITVPLVLDPDLPDFLVPLDVYLQRSRVQWQPNDRFKMFIPPKPSQKRSKSTGAWKKGTVIQIQATADREDGPEDPWESVVVEYDTAPMGETNFLSPWMIEIDPEEEMRMSEEAKKIQQAVARAQRARSLARAPDSPEAAAEESAQLAEEGLRMEVAIRQAQRSNELLNIHRFKEFREFNVVSNEDVYGVEALAEYKKYLSELGMSTYKKYAPYAALASSGKSKPGGRMFSPNTGSMAMPTGPLIPGQQVPEKVLEALRALTPDQFMVLLTNFYMGLKGKYKVPIFAHRELDIYTVWWSVVERGGYESVTAEKQWKDICRCLNLDLSGQTSASYNMRLNYERCLLDFENYLACGQYEADLASNRAPVHTHLTDPALTRFTIPGAYDNITDNEPCTRQASESMPDKSAPSSPRMGSTIVPLKIPSTSAATLDGTTQATPSTKISLTIKSDKLSLSKPTMIKLKPKQSTGWVMRQREQDAIGEFIELYWPSEGGWWKAEIVDFNPDTGEHQLLYDEGGPNESTEWTDLSTLSETELRKFDTEQ